MPRNRASTNPASAAASSAWYAAARRMSLIESACAIDQQASIRSASSRDGSGGVAGRFGSQNRYQRKQRTAYQFDRIAGSPSGPIALGSSAKPSSR